MKKGVVATVALESAFNFTPTVRIITSDFQGTEPCMRDIFFCIFLGQDPLEWKQAIRFHQCMKHSGIGLLPTASIASHMTPCMCCLILVPCIHTPRRRQSYKYQVSTNIHQFSIQISSTTPGKTMGDSIKIPFENTILIHQFLA